MKNSKTLNLVLMPLLGVSAFALGWALKPAPEAPRLAAEADERTRDRATGLSALEGVGSQGRSGGSLGSGGEATGGGATTGRGSLSERRITELGENFKSTLDPIQRRLVFSQLLGGLTAENALRVREQIEHLPAGSPEFRDFHYAWGQVVGADAVMHGAETEKPDMAAALSGWASADPEAAIAWFNGLEEKSDEERQNFANRDYLKMGIVQGLADSNPERAGEFVLALASAGDPRAGQMLNVVTTKLLQSRGPEAAAAWVDGLPDGKMRSASMNRVAYDYARKDPAQAAAWAESHAGGEGGAGLVGAVSRQWAQRDGPAAVGWLESLAGSVNKGDGYRAAFEGWVGRDPQAASQYIVDMPASADRDQAIGGLVSRHRWEDPEAAIAWAGEIGDPKTRQTWLVNAGVAYLRRDPAAAKTWIANSGFSPEVQHEITSGARMGSYGRKQQ